MNDMVDGTTCPGGCESGSKWALVTTAINQALPRSEAAINWGLKVFATSGGDACSVSKAVEVAPQPSNAATIAASIGTVATNDATPTTAAVSAAAMYLSRLTDGSHTFIVLVTDGTPSCGNSTCMSSDIASGPCDDANAVVAVMNARNLGIPTFVVGIGTAVRGEIVTLDYMADAGGYARTESPAYYPVDDAAALTATLTTIAAIATQP